MTLKGDLYADGHIFARHMTAGSITAANGAIDALAVKSLNIQDQAVTVPETQSLSFAVSGNGAAQLVLGYTTYIDTTGLAGKSITLFALFNAQQSYFGSGANTYLASIQFNGVPAIIIGGDAVDCAITASATHQFIGTGGVVGVTVLVYWFGVTSNLALGQRTLFSMAVKR